MAQDVTKAAFESHREIFVIDPDGGVRQLTHDSIPKDLPLWSKDGTRIAWFQKQTHSLALGQLRVVDPETGETVSQANLRDPGESPQMGNDLQFIDRLEWISSDRLVASGSVNPSTEESLVVDLKSGKEIISYYDDNGGAVFSPDGNHVAYVSGAPHFVPPDAKRPEVNIDKERVFPVDGVQIRMLSNIVWSSDSEHVAFVAQQTVNQTVSIVTCGLGSGCVQAQLTQTSPPYSIRWVGDSVMVATEQSSWAVVAGSNQVKAGAADHSSVPSQSRAVDAVTRKAKQGGGRSVDVWCRECELATQPRSTEGK
jgi:hypothetical protein